MSTTACKTFGIERFRYGASVLWTIRDDLAGSSARRLAERVDLFFRGGGTSLLLDLRAARSVDSAGAEALTRCRRRHDGFRTVGSPAAWQDLPLATRIALQELAPAASLESALANALPHRGREERRRSSRVPVQVPVEVLLEGVYIPVTMHDISRGGIRLGQVPAEWIDELRQSPKAPAIGILGLDADPLARELTGRHTPGPVRALPVHLNPGSAFGARFLASHAPV